uniref:E3 ubiquitin-protein ligase XIAP n=1 Tax=Ciona intestinalis TaxID=7719 RepID=UPI000EF51DFA
KRRKVDTNNDDWHLSNNVSSSTPDEDQGNEEEPGSIKEAILKKLCGTTVLHEEYVTFGLSKHYDKVKTLIECLHYVDGALVGQGDDYIASHDAALNEIFKDARGVLKSFEKPPKVDQMLVAVYGVSCMKYEDFKHWLKSIRGKQHIVSEALHTACFLLNPEYDGFSATFSRLPNSAWRDMMIKKRELMKQFLSYLLPLESKSPVKFYEFIRQLSIELGASDIEDKANKRLANQITTKEEQGKLHCLQQTTYYKDSDIEHNGPIYDRPRDPPGQRSVYIPPGDAAMESYRLSTFMKYPQDTPVNPRHLAAAGFHYTGYKDRVKCFCCGLCVESWCVGDDVKSPRWHRSNCEFILGQDCGNQPIGGLFGNFMRPSGSTGAGGDLFRDFGRQGSQNISVQQTARPVPAGMIMKSGPNQSTPMQTARVVEPTKPASQYQRVELATIASPYHEKLVRSLDLRKESDRFKTYENWPAQNRTVYASDLARSGFFYLGNLDRVQCFSCGGVLRNWNYGDNITAEHRRHFPHCRMVQGTENKERSISCSPPRLTSGGNLYTSVADLVDDITANENEPNSDDDDETNTSQPSQTTTVKTTGFTELPTNESMETEISIPPDVTPSMEARIREIQEERKCKICLDKVADIVFVPCGHLCTCTECAKALRKCPICRSKFERGIKTYMS